MGLPPAAGQSAYHLGLPTGTARILGPGNVHGRGLDLGTSSAALLATAKVAFSVTSALGCVSVHVLIPGVPAEAVKLRVPKILFRRYEDILGYTKKWK